MSSESQQAGRGQRSPALPRPGCRGHRNRKTLPELSPQTPHFLSVSALLLLATDSRTSQKVNLGAALVGKAFQASVSAPALPHTPDPAEETLPRRPPQEQLGVQPDRGTGPPVGTATAPQGDKLLDGKDGFPYGGQKARPEWSQAEGSGSLGSPAG